MGQPEKSLKSAVQHSFEKIKVQHTLPGGGLVKTPTTGVNGVRALVIRRLPVQVSAQEEMQLRQPEKSLKSAVRYLFEKIKVQHTLPGGDLVQTPTTRV